MKEVLKTEIYEKIVDEIKVHPDSLAQIIKGSEFNFDTINFTGTVPVSRAFSILVVRPPKRSAVGDKRLFYCQYEECSRIFVNLYKMFDHIRSHSNEKPYVC